MKIIIKSNDNHNINLWLPSGPLVINLFLRFLKIDDFKFDKLTRKRIVKEIQKLKKQKKDVLLIDIETVKGEKVFVKI